MNRTQREANKEDCDFCGPQKMGVEEVLKSIPQNPQKPAGSQAGAQAGAAQAGAQGNAHGQSQGPQSWPMEAPPNKDEVGRASWALLHSMAALYPDSPPPEKIMAIRTFLNSLALVYPCLPCAKDFQEFIRASPPRLTSQHEFSQWMCEAHNHVNVQLGKPHFDCSRVDERWKYTRKRTDNAN
jgi:FAD-linked sulfhydryl oxidase